MGNAKSSSFRRGLDLEHADLGRRLKGLQASVLPPSEIERRLLGERGGGFMEELARQDAHQEIPLIIRRMGEIEESARPSRIEHLWEKAKAPFTGLSEKAKEGADTMEMLDAFDAYREKVYPDNSFWSLPLKDRQSAYASFKKDWESSRKK
jgi:hypothetical protein